MDKEHTANTRISNRLNEKLEKIIEEGGIHSRSEAVRFSIHMTYFLMVQDESVKHDEIRAVINDFINK